MRLELEELKWRVLLSAGRAYGFDDDEDDEGALGGAVVVSPYGPVAFVGMLLVRPRLRRAGFGRTLMQLVLAEFPAATAMLYATPMGRRLYESMGFVERGVLISYTGRFADPSRTALEAVAPSALAPHAVEAIVAADADAFGAPRPALIHALLAVAERVVTVERAGVLSYGVAWPNVDVMHAGPIVAADDETAAEILRALADGVPSAMRIDLAPERTQLRRWVGERGLAAVNEAALMTRGTAALPGPRAVTVAMQATG